MVDQDPGALGEEAALVIKEVLMLRYYLLPYLYTLFALQTMTGNPSPVSLLAVPGSTVARPVWHSYPRETSALGLDTQFLLGPDILLCPVLLEGADSRSCYIPPGLWYEGYGLRSQPGGLRRSEGSRLLPRYLAGGRGPGGDHGDAPQPDWGLL